MPLKANAAFTYTGTLINQDGSVTFYLSCPNPGPNMPGDYAITLTSTEVAAVAGAGTLAQQGNALDAIVGPRIAAQYRPVSPAIAAALAVLPGRNLTVA